jgi:polyisoprenoid-binding protein YceI
MKTRTLAGSLMAAALIISAPLMAADYSIDKEGQHAFVNFKASHLGYSYIIGRFTDFEGSFSHDDANASASSVNVTINSKSVDTNHAERDKHLRSDDFFNVDKQPQMTFASTGYDGKQLKGDLTIMGVTKSVILDVTKIGEGKDPWGGYRAGFTGAVTLAAADFGLPKWIGNMEVELNVEGVK